MPDLEMLLRDLRPAPDPAWAARLDTRVAQRFPRPPARWKRPFIAFRENLFAFGAVATVATGLIVLVLAAMNSTGGGADNEATSASMSSDAAATPAAAAEDSAGGSGGASGKFPQRTESASKAAPLADQQRDVKTTTAITLTTTPDRVQSVSDRAIRVVDGVGGYVQSSETDIAGSHATATLSLRIPAGKLDEGLARLSKLANVTARSQQTEDLTDQREYLEARVRDARADRDGLRVRLVKATTDKERSSLRAQLDKATRRVTQREREVAELGQEVAYATVDLSIEGRKRSGGAAVDKPGDRWTPGDALGDAGRVLEVIAGVAVIALAILIPVGVIVVIAMLLGRVLTRHRRLRALEMA